MESPSLMQTNQGSKCLSLTDKVVRQTICCNKNLRKYVSSIKIESMRKVALLIFTGLIIMACKANSHNFTEAGKPDHSMWTELLQKHVADKGMVNYEGFISDKTKLNAYADELSSNPPADNWSREEKLAYWINAYNVFTVKLIVDNYPVESIKDLNPAISIPTVNTVWTKKWFQIGGEDFSLDQIEHKILRKDFEEPRIHFAVNCASISCPVLRPEAYVADKIESQLDEQASIFLNDSSRNKISKNEAMLSKIFSWFGGDFTEGQTLVEFVNKYANTKLAKDAKIKYLDYDWNLNDTK